MKSVIKEKGNGQQEKLGRFNTKDLEEANVISPKARSRMPAQNSIDLPPFAPKQVTVRIKGIAPLMVHSWGQKQVEQILRTVTDQAQLGRTPKNPIEEFEGACYPVKDERFPKGYGYGVKGAGLKDSLVTAANSVKLKMTQMKQAFHISGDIVPVFAPPLPKELYNEWDKKYEKELEYYHQLGITMDMRMVRLDNGAPDIRFRPLWPEWECFVEVDFNRSLISEAQLVNLFRAAGWGCGIGELRPSAPNSRTGSFGRFAVPGVEVSKEG